MKQYELTKISNKLFELGIDICEEKTKQYLILPVIQYMGYDVFSHLDIIPEYKPRHYTGNDRVDYALCEDSVPKIYVEAKRLDTKLDNKNITWLAKYFNSDPNIHLGILTNGKEYMFFTDTEHENLMDKNPFYVFDLRRYSYIDEYLIDYFSKGQYGPNSIQYCIKTIGSLDSLNKSFHLAYSNKEKFYQLKDQGNDYVMDYLYNLGNIDKDILPYVIAYKVLPIHKL